MGAYVVLNTTEVDVQKLRSAFGSQVEHVIPWKNSSNVTLIVDDEGDETGTLAKFGAMGYYAQIVVLRKK